MPRRSPTLTATPLATTTLDEPSLPKRCCSGHNKGLESTFPGPPRGREGGPGAAWPRGTAGANARSRHPPGTRGTRTCTSCCTGSPRRPEGRPGGPARPAPPAPRRRPAPPPPRRHPSSGPRLATSRSPVRRRTRPRRTDDWEGAGAGRGGAGAILGRASPPPSAASQQPLQDAPGRRHLGRGGLISPVASSGEP